VKVSYLLFLVVLVSCTQHTTPPAQNNLYGNGDQLFFAQSPNLTPISLDQDQLFMPLFAQLSDLPKIPYKNLAVQLEAIGQEADKIKPSDFPEALQIPQLIGRFNVFRTRVGIVRYADVSQHTSPKFAAAMDDVVFAWNTFARHYNRLATPSNS